MNKDSLKNLIIKESEVLKKLLCLLDKQYKLLIKNNIFGLEAVVDEIAETNKEVATIEVQRRQLVKGASMKALVQNFNDNELNDEYRNIVRLLSELEVQKKSNEMLIKQGLGFSSKMLALINPNKSAKTYNGSGKIGR